MVIDLQEKIIFIIVISIMISPVYALTNIPEWIKNNAAWWADGQIDDSTFVQGIQYMIKNEIISLDDDLQKSPKIYTDLVTEYFDVWVYKNDIYLEDGIPVAKEYHFGLKEELTELYQEIGILNQKIKVLVILPIFTSSAYGDNGFYDYYLEICDSCHITKIVKNDFLEFFTASQLGAKVLQTLGYESMTDVDIDKNPKILETYDTIIVLHNEYVTRAMFDAITQHQNVIYLYPNALYAEIDVNYEKNEISLIRGHGYPNSEISNGFDWEYDNTRPYEYDETCLDWEFYDIPNGKMLNCYPEKIIVSDIELLKKIKELSG